MVVSRFCRVPPRPNLFSFIFFVARACFWSVVVCKILCGGHLRLGHVLFLLFFVAHFNGPNDRITSYPNLITQLAITPTSNPSLSPTFGWLLCLSFEWQPSKAEGLPTSLILIFCQSIWWLKQLYNVPPHPNCPAHHQLDILSIAVADLQLVIASFNWMAAT